MPIYTSVKKKGHVKFPDGAADTDMYVFMKTQSWQTTVTALAAPHREQGVLRLLAIKGKRNHTKKAGSDQK